MSHSLGVSRHGYRVRLGFGPTLSIVLFIGTLITIAFPDGRYPVGVSSVHLFKRFRANFSDLYNHLE